MHPRKVEYHTSRVTLRIFDRAVFCQSSNVLGAVSAFMRGDEIMELSVVVDGD